MNKEKEKSARKLRRRGKIRSTITGTESRPRLSVFKSNTGVYLQLIDDKTGKTLASTHSKEVADKPRKMTSSSRGEPGKTDSSSRGEESKEFKTGKLLAEKAVKLKITEVVFDRGGNKYHGRIKLVADGAREGGLKF